MHSKLFLKIVYLLVFFTFLISGCKRPKDSAIAVTDKQALGTYYVDTFSAVLSTLFVDSLPTSINDKVLVGTFSDPGRIGNFAAASYFQFSLAGIDTDGNGREDILTYTGTPVYDSMVMVFNHVYTYGDTVTTPIQKMDVYRLAEDMHYYNGNPYLYNSQSFATQTTPLVTKTFRFTQSAYQTLRIRMDNLGTEFFNYAYQLDNRVATNDAFKTYFKGVALRPNSNTTSTCVYGYSLPVMILYYHDDANPTISLTYTFKHGSSDFFFNQLKNDRSTGAPHLSSLKSIYQEVPASLTNNEAYVMTGVDLMAKLKFPYVNLVHAINPNVSVNRAYLYISPKDKSYNPFFKLPTNLTLYASNDTNIPGAIISYQGTSVPEIISPVTDYQFNQFTYYKFDVTDFITAQIKTNYYQGDALILGSIRSLSGNRTERLVLNNNFDSYTIQLKLYLTIF